MPALSEENDWRFLQGNRMKPYYDDGKGERWN